jgi:hypothetical protein
VVTTAECGPLTSNEAALELAPPAGGSAFVSAPDVPCVNTAAAITVAPSGIEPFTFHWRRNGAPIDPAANPSAVTDTLNVAVLRATDVYDCLITDACGAGVSDPAFINLCAADFNCSGAADLLDIFAFLNAWFAADPRADIDGLNGVDLLDVFGFVNTWFTGC